MRTVIFWGDYRELVYVACVQFWITKCRSLYANRPYDHGSVYTVTQSESILGYVMGAALFTGPVIPFIDVVFVLNCVSTVSLLL